MLVTVQLPFTDSRHFMRATETGLLPVAPAFPTLTPGESFIRAFGPLRRRRRGGISAWPGEELYADARRAIRFEDGFGPERWEGGWWEESRKKAAFRRLLCDGTATNRVEIGVAIDRPWGLTPEADEVASQVLGLPMWVRGGDDAIAKTTLGGSGGRVAQHFLRSTSAVEGESLDAPGWWCQSGPTAVLIESSDLDPPRRAIALVSGLEDQGIQLYHWYQEHGGRDVDVWLMRDSYSDWGTSRKVRIHLLRLHAEWHALRTVLQHLTRQRIRIEPRTDHSDRLQRFLNEKTHLIERRRLDGMPQSELLEAAYRSDELIHEGERASLRRALESARPNITRKLDELAKVKRPRILLLAANAAQMPQLALGPENSAIYDALSAGLGGEFNLASFWSVKRGDVQKRLSDTRPHIVHFAAHADEVGEIVFVDEHGQPSPIPTDALADMFRLHEDVRCAFLNACSSLEIAEAISEHVDIVLGTTRKILDHDARRFAEQFYASLGSGDSFQRAYELAVNALEAQDRPNVTELLVRDGVDATSLTLHTMMGR